jgi:hypothetical protein
MRRPQYPLQCDQPSFDAREDLVQTLALLRRAVRERGRADVETYCRAFLRRLADVEIRLDDRAEMSALVELLQDRAKYGLTERLRKLLLPLVAAVECQMEASAEG